MIIADRIWHKNSIRPKSELLKVIPPMLAIKKVGDEVEQIASALSASVFSILFVRYKSATVFAPTG